MVIARRMLIIKQAIQEAYPGIYVHSIQIGKDEKEDRLASVYDNLNRQVERHQGPYAIDFFPSADLFMGRSVRFALSYRQTRHSRAGLMLWDSPRADRSCAPTCSAATIPPFTTSSRLEPSIRASWISPDAPRSMTETKS